VFSLTMKGSNNDKKLLAMRIVAHVFEIIHLLAGQSPIQVCLYFILLMYATLKRVRKGSHRRHCQKRHGLPLQHVDSSISPPIIGARKSAICNVKSIAECLADELINTAKGSCSSYAIE
ncbi:ribosomal protein S5, partial [Mycena leptocephala]